MPTPQRSSSPSTARDHAAGIVEVVVRWGNDVVAAGSVGVGGSLHLLDGDVCVSVAVDEVIVAGVVEARLARAGGSAEGAGLQVEVSARRAEAIVADDIDIDVGFARTLLIGLVMNVGLLSAAFITPAAPTSDDSRLDFSTLATRTELLRMSPPPKPAVSPPPPSSSSRQTMPAASSLPSVLASASKSATSTKQRRDDNQALAVKAMRAMGLGSAQSVLTGHEMDGLVGDALASLTGAVAADVGGITGLGTRSMGQGVSGAAVGIGALGSGGVSGVGNSGNVNLIGRGHRQTRIQPGNIVYAGALDRAEIQRVIARHLSQIQYCYDRQLIQDPALEGKLVLRWQIAGSGDVASVSTLQTTFSGAAGSAVEACVTRVVRRLQFPQPRGGGVVDVSYPFVFFSAGDAGGRF